VRIYRSKEERVRQDAQMLEDHRQDHIQWHQALERLCDDWANHHPGARRKRLRNASIADLFKWSAQQAEKPIWPEEGRRRAREAAKRAAAKKAAAKAVR